GHALRALHPAGREAERTGAGNRSQEDGAVQQRRGSGRERNQDRESLHAAPGRPLLRARFHGRTLMALSLTSRTHPYKAGFEPFASDVYRLPYGNAHALEEAFKPVVAAESVAAVIVEPVLGEGGFIVPPVEFFAALEQTCRKYGI